VSRRVLIIGGTRFVGRFLTARLLAQADRVTLFNRGTFGDPFAGRVEQVHGDRGTGDLERAIAGRTFDAVVDFAAYEGRDVERAIATFRGRVGQYVFISTGSVYLVRAGLEPPFREEHYDGALIERPSGDESAGFDYGAGKRACEDALVAARDFPSTRLRIPVVNGPGDYYARIDNYVHRMLDGGPLAVESAGRRVRHVDAQEVARTIDLLLGDARALGVALNQTQDETPTVRELLTMIGREVGVEPKLVEVRDPPFDLRAASPYGGNMSFLDPSRIRALGIDHAPLPVTIARAVGHVLATMKTPADYAQRPAELAYLNQCITRGEI